MPEGLELKDIESVHNLLLRITEEIMGEKVPLPPAIESIRQGTPSPDAAAVAAGWLWLLDAGIGPQHLRQAIEKMDLQSEEFQALVRYLARKRPLREVDIEKLEWLVTYIFRNRSASGGQTSSAEMRQEIQSWVGGQTGGLSGTAETLLSEMVEILEDLTGCRTFRELTQSGLIERGRSVKQRFKEDFVHPLVLAAVVNYNLVSRRKFESLLSEALGSGGFPLELTTKEYRTAAKDFEQLAEAGGPAVAPPAQPPRAAAAAETSPPEAAPAPPSLTPAGPEGLGTRLGMLGIDAGMEEGRLRARFNELVSFALAAGNPVDPIPLPNSSLALAPWEVQSLVVEYPAVEKSFRADFNRQVRRAVALLAAIQEATALYEMKRDSEHFWKTHVNTLIYLLYCGNEALPNLEHLAQEASRKGLQEKAAQLGDTAQRLRDKLRMVSELVQQWKDPSAHKRTYGG